MTSRYPSTVQTEALPGAVYKRNKGVKRAIRAAKREEAEARNANANAVLQQCGHVHGLLQVSRCAIRLAPVTTLAGKLARIRSV